MIPGPVRPSCAPVAVMLLHYRVPRPVVARWLLDCTHAQAGLPPPHQLAGCPGYEAGSS